MSREKTSPAPAAEEAEPIPTPKMDPPTNFARERPFSCTFSGCHLAFKTKAQLNRHKASDESGHEYCKYCDMDFEDDDAHHMHKMTSDKHICCGICSEDFKSEEGCNRHMAQVWFPTAAAPNVNDHWQMHTTAQNIKCRGCGKKFLKGAALVKHIEGSQCPVINKVDFETQRAMVAVNMHKMSNREQDEFGLLSFTTSTAGASSADGGVPVGVDSLLDNEDMADEVNMNMPSLGRVLSNGSVATTTASIAHSKAYEQSYPALSTASSGNGKGKGKGKENEKGNVANDQRSQHGTWAEQHFPDAPRTPAPADWQQVPSSDTGIISTIDASSGRRGHFRVADIKRDPMDGNYHCPFANCKYVSPFFIFSFSFLININPIHSVAPLPTIELLTAHLQSGKHKGVDHRCVGCLRLFATPSALTAHMESSSERCRVRETRQFANALSLVSGGYLGVNGRHADGSLKIDTPSAPVPQW